MSVVRSLLECGAAVIVCLAVLPRCEHGECTPRQDSAPSSDVLDTRLLRIVDEKGRVLMELGSSKEFRLRDEGGGDWYYARTPVITAGEIRLYEAAYGGTLLRAGPVFAGKGHKRSRFGLAGYLSIFGASDDDGTYSAVRLRGGLNGGSIQVLSGTYSGIELSTMGGKSLIRFANDALRPGAALLPFKEQGIQAMSADGLGHSIVLDAK